MKAIYGQCGSCVAGKNSTVNHGPISHSPPPTSAGEFLHADLITLDNGVTILLSKDDHSGYVLPVKLLLGKTKSSLSDGWDVTRRHYNALEWNNSSFSETLSCFISCRFSTSLSHFMPSSNSLSGQHNCHSMYRFVYLSQLNLNMKANINNMALIEPTTFRLCI